MAQATAPTLDRSEADGGSAGRFRLRRPPAHAHPDTLTAEQQAVVHFPAGRLRVLAGPGTGKTETLVEAVAERISARGIAARSILVLTFSRRAAAELTERITRRIALTSTEPMVRTLHSYAYSILRAQAVRLGEPAPRLLAAGESDQMVRELLAGHREGGRHAWPDSVRAALTSTTFAAELRELLLRAAERGVGPGRLAEWGRRHRRPEWVAAAAFAREYRDVADLRQGSSGFGAALDQAELTAAALGVLADDAVLSAEQARRRHIFVDEFQDVDPAQARLVEVLGAAADELVVCGDPDQAIYGFRGADSRALHDFSGDATVRLTASHRLPPDLLVATRRVAGRLPGAGQHRTLTPVASPQAGADGGPDGDPLTVCTLPTAAAEAAFVADELRRAHLLDGVPWSRMAVLSRSPGATEPALTRACLAAGVPLLSGRAGATPTRQPIVRTLLTVLRCGYRPESLDGETAIDLLSSPAAGLDTPALRRVRRILRAAAPQAGPSTDLLAGVLGGAPLPEDMPPALAAPVQRLAGMIAAARRGSADPDAEGVLWRVWSLSGLQDDLLASSLRGGRTGQQADAALDAVVAVFEHAADLAERLPGAGVRAFVDDVLDRVISDDGLPPARAGEAVAVLSAHAAKGLEWDVVCVIGVTEGRWPILRDRPSLLGVQDLVDAAAGMPPSLDRRASLLDDERRLFYVAVTRARRRVIATAVSDQDTVPSRFLAELAGTDALVGGPPLGGGGRRRRALRLADLVADLRATVTDPAAAAVDRERAARHLARLAEAGVQGAHPNEWFGLGDRSTDAPPTRPGEPVAVSPSHVEASLTCGLRGVLERRAGAAEPTQPQIEGIVVHALVAGLAAGFDADTLAAHVDEHLAGQSHLPPWQVERSRRALRAMAEAAGAWVAERGPDRTAVGSEIAVEADLPSDDGTDARIRIAGRIDWLDRRPDGSLVVVDFKTGATVPSKAAVAENAQLGTYQLAIDLGGVGDACRPQDRTLADAGARSPQAVPGGAELVYLRTGRPQLRTQPAPGPDDLAEWRAGVREAARAWSSSVVNARENGRCDRCPVRGSCPLQPSGRQVTR